MQFPFTFAFTVPGLQNPFLANTSHPRFQRTPPPKHPPAHSLSPPVPLARKRGWIPSQPAPSHPATSSESTSGYLGQPATYTAVSPREPVEEADEMVADLPPAKRRRTLAGSIVSTALNAALIGTAVGLTVYRLWRDRGKQHDQLPPPPPYQRGDWVPDVAEPPKQIEVASSRLDKTHRSRPTPSSVRRTVGRHSRKPRARLQTITPPRSVSPTYIAPQSEFDFIHVSHRADNIDQDLEPESDEMDWIGDRLTRLIQEGQKALGREIVVMSDAKEDEVDDGSDAWEEEQGTQSVSSIAGPSISRRGSVRSLRRTQRPRDSPLPPSYSPYPASPPGSRSPRKRRFEPDPAHHSPGRSTRARRVPVPSTPRRIARDMSVESDVLAPIVSSFKEDESAWQSPELRETMARARARYLQGQVQ